MLLWGVGHRKRRLFSEGGQLFLERGASLLSFVQGKNLEQDPEPTKISGGAAKKTKVAGGKSGGTIVRKKGALKGGLAMVGGGNGQEDAGSKKKKG